MIPQHDDNFENLDPTGYWQTVIEEYVMEISKQAGIITEQQEMIQELQNKIRLLEAQVGKLPDNSSKNSQRTIPKQNASTLPRVSLTNNQRGGASSSSEDAPVFERGGLTIRNVPIPQPSQPSVIRSRKSPSPPNKRSITKEQSPKRNQAFLNSMTPPSKKNNQLQNERTKRDFEIATQLQKEEEENFKMVQKRQQEELLALQRQFDDEIQLQDPIDHHLDQQDLPHVDYESLLELDKNVIKVPALKSKVAKMAVFTYTPTLTGLDECFCAVGYTSADRLLALPCGHVFHKRCIEKWFEENHVCPVCKRDVNE